MYQRIQTLANRAQNSCFLWGPRQTGKSTLLKELFPQAPYYDLLRGEEFERLNRTPGLLREELLALRQQPTVVIIDEVQKIPQLLDEIHWLIVNTTIHFILCGSSARTLKRHGANLLGGRALRYELYPLVSQEIPQFDLVRAINHGLLPRHYLSDQPQCLLQAYVGDYLQQEIAQEALTRRVQTFAHFLDVAALSNGEQLNYQNIARECGISGPTVKEYFQILYDTLIAYELPAYQKRPKRRLLHTSKFYFFDVGIVNFLLKRNQIVPGSELFGRAFEHIIFQELKAHSHYSGQEYPLSYWRTTSGFEVDFILGDHEVAIEVKGVPQVQSHHLKGLRAFQTDYKPRRAYVVSLDQRPRRIGDIDILPAQVFLERLWSGSL